MYLKLDHISFWHTVVTFCKCHIYSLKLVCNGLEPISCVSATKGRHNKGVSFMSTRTWGKLLVAQLVEALRYKSEGRGFDFRWFH